MTPFGSNLNAGRKKARNHFVDQAHQIADHHRLKNGGDGLKNGLQRRHEKLHRPFGGLFRVTDFIESFFNTNVSSKHNYKVILSANLDDGIFNQKIDVVEIAIVFSSWVYFPIGVDNHQFPSGIG